MVSPTMRGEYRRLREEESDVSREKEGDLKKKKKRKARVHTGVEMRHGEDVRKKKKRC